MELLLLWGSRLTRFGRLTIFGSQKVSLRQLNR
jgi:hypothetical protein